MLSINKRVCLELSSNMRVSQRRAKGRASHTSALAMLKESGKNMRRVDRALSEEEVCRSGRAVRNPTGLIMILAIRL